jgi:hypothetical protein
MFTYIQNVLGDMIYGYIEIKCANKLCNRVFKLTRNSYYDNGKTDYSCNMGCAFEAFNQYEIFKENDKENDS